MFDHKHGYHTGTQNAFTHIQTTGLRLPNSFRETSLLNSEAMRPRNESSNAFAACFWFAFDTTAYKEILS